MHEAMLAPTEVTGSDGMHANLALCGRLVTVHIRCIAAVAASASRIIQV